jgi:hypothetical protein
MDTDCTRSITVDGQSFTSPPLLPAHFLREPSGIAYRPLLGCASSRCRRMDSNVRHKLDAARTLAGAVQHSFIRIKIYARGTELFHRYGPMRTVYEGPISIIVGSQVMSSSCNGVFPILLLLHLLKVAERDGSAVHLPLSCSMARE